MALKRETANDKLDKIGIDAICDLIEEDKSYKVIADELGVKKPTLLAWIQEDADRSARAKTALENSARFNDDAALQAIQALQPGATSAEIAKARELAQHYRWRARVRSPKVYGEKMTLSGDPENPLQGISDDQLEARLSTLLSKQAAIDDKS